ncbi:MAG: glycerol kinase GlpK [Candidatus Margulisiibacteriota bacterium]
MILTFDLGTTGNRALVLDETGKTLAQAYSEFPQYFPNPGWVEHNPTEILETALSVAKTAIATVGIEALHAIAITNQRETTVVWNKHTGKPYYNAIVWQCRRTTEICAQWAPHRGLIKDKTGLFLDPYFSASKLRWLLDNVPGLRQDAEAGIALFGTIDSWLIWNLTQGKTHATDATNASRTMLVNLKTQAYDDELLRLFGIPKAMLPTLLNSDADFGDATVFEKPLPIRAVLGDQQAALFAQNHSGTGIVKNTYGTGLFVVTATETPQVSDRLISTIAWKTATETRYALEGSVFVGGSLVQWLRDGLGLIHNAAEIETLARTVDDSDGVVIIPALTGLGAPYWMPDAKGLITGLTRGTTKAHIARAALEALAYQTRDVIEQMGHEGVKVSLLRADGGASQNTLLMQLQADILGIPVQTTTCAEATAFGVAALAAQALGKPDFRAQGNAIKTTFSPKWSEDLRTRRYSDWLSAVGQCLSA